MKAYVEITSFVVRAGEETDCYGAPFDVAVAGIASGSRAILKALTNEGLKPSHFKAAVAALGYLGITEITWDRFNKNGELIMDDKYEVTLTWECKKNGHGFSKTVQTYQNMNYDAMHSTQGAVTNALLGLGNAKMGKSPAPTP